MVEILDEGREGYRSEVIASAYFTARNMGVSSDAIDVEFPRTPAGSKVVELGARWWEAEQARLASKYIPKDDFAAYRAAAVVAWALTQPVCDSDLRIVHAAAVLATAQGGPRFRAGQYLFALTAGINVRTFRKRQASLVDWGYLQSVHRPTPGLAGVWGLPNLTAPYREAHVDPQIAPSLMGDVAGALSSDAFRHKALGRAYRAFARSLVQERNGESRFGGELLLGGCEEVLVEHGLVDPRGRPVPEWRDLLPAIARRYGTDGSHERVERKLEKQRYWEQMDEVQPRLDAVAQSQARR